MILKSASTSSLKKQKSNNLSLNYFDKKRVYQKIDPFLLPVFYLPIISTIHYFNQLLYFVLIDLEAISLISYSEWVLCHRHGHATGSFVFA